MKVIVESDRTTDGRNGEKNGRKWSFRVQRARGEFEDRQGEKFMQDIRLKLWNGDNPYPEGEYNAVFRYKVNQWGDVEVADLLLEPAEVKSARKLATA